MIVAGIGFRRSAGFDALQILLAAAGIAPDRLATAADKADALRALARPLGLLVEPIALQALAAQPAPTHAPNQPARYGTQSLAEAAALAAAGPGARLLLARQTSPDRTLTLAIAESAP